MAPSGFGYYKTVTVDHTKVLADLSSFPVLVSIAGDTSLGARCRADGYDVVFTDSTGETLLNFERESFAITGGACTAVFWVKTDLSSGSDTVIRMYYGNASQTTDPQTTNGGTWDEGGTGHYKGVYHLSEQAAGTVGNYKNSVSDNYHSTNTTNQPALNTSGKIGNCQTFTGGSNHVALNASAQNLVSASAATVSVLCRPTGATSANVAYCYNGLNIIDNDGGGGAWGDWGISRASLYNVDRIYAYIYTGNFYSVGITYTVDEWVKFDFVLAGGYLSVYKNGAYVSQITCANLTNGAAVPIRIGNARNGFSGDIDEARFSDVGRSANWLAAEYANQNAPDKDISGTSGFYTLGAETSASGSEPTTLALSSTVAGTGASTATITVTTYQPLSSTVSGTGLLTANIIGYSRIGSTIAGVGLLTANIIEYSQIVSTNAGVGLLTSNAALNENINSTVLGTGDSTANINRLIPVASAVEGSGSYTGAAALNQIINSSISGVGLLTANLIEYEFISSNVSGTGTLTANIIEYYYLISSISGTGLSTANMNVISNTVDLTANISGSGAYTSNIFLFEQINSSISGTGLLTASPSLNQIISSSIVGSGSLTANIIEYSYLLSSILGSGSLSANMNVISNSVDLYSNVAGSGLATANLLTYNYISSNIVGSGAITATVSINQSISSSVDGSGSSTANVAILEMISSMVAGLGLSLANMTIIIPDKIDLAYPLTVSIYQNLRTVLIYQKKWTVTII